MKSLFLDKPYIDCPESYSDLQVLHSAAGYYIGSVFHDEQLGDVPGTRDTGYFEFQADAQDFLNRLETGDPEVLKQLRTHP